MLNKLRARLHKVQYAGTLAAISFLFVFLGIPLGFLVIKVLGGLFSYLVVVLGLPVAYTLILATVVALIIFLCYLY